MEAGVVLLTATHLQTRGVRPQHGIFVTMWMMRQRVALAIAVICFLILFVLVVWQGSFSFGSYGPANSLQTAILWAVSVIIFLLFVTLAFMLARTLVKLYIERQHNREGSRIRTKLIAGALALSLTPVLFMVLFSVYVLNRNLEKWFRRPSVNIETNLQQIDATFRTELQNRAQTEVNWLSLVPQTLSAAQTGQLDNSFFTQICSSEHIGSLVIHGVSGNTINLCPAKSQTSAPNVHAATNMSANGLVLGRLVAYFPLSADLAQKQAAIDHYLQEQRALGSNRKFYKDVYFQIICVITLFVLFVASWMSQILARQISIPVSALLEAAKEVRQGNLAFRVRVKAMDELATLVRSFNEMTRDLESNAKELEARRRFTEAILESIPTGVLSVSDDGRIERVNRAFRGIFSDSGELRASRINDLFQGENLEELRYLMKRARRTGAAGSQIEITINRRVLHLALTVSSLEERRGFVIVVEDTSDLLRAQKTAAWQEVARRIAHEIKNPLTPISLSADRMERQLRRLNLSDDVRAILNECTSTIQQEVQTVKTLVDEFSQFSRFPAAQPLATDLNEIVESAMAVFASRLVGVNVTLDLATDLPQVMADREQIKRVIVNLVDNAAEAMESSPIKSLLVATYLGAADTVDLVVTDTGCGVSPIDKEKMFLPYFSTKDRGTGLGLAIVSHIVAEHGGRVRVEDNIPAGARFIVELPAQSVSEPEASRTQEPALGSV